jgi:hypothetical protein
MHVLGINGAGLADIVSSSAHGYGLWLHEQRPGNVFLTRDIFPSPPALAKEPKGFAFNKEEIALLSAINKVRDQQKRSPWRTETLACEQARKWADLTSRVEDGPSVPGLIRSLSGSSGDHRKAVEQFMKEVDSVKLNGPNFVIGVGFSSGCYALLLFDLNRFSLPGQTHALQYVDINGDGLKDLVTGRRWWAHGAGGDVSPADPAYLYWFEAKKDATGVITFTPHRIDDDSGVGTQFEVIDINGDGLLDVVISNKKGVFIFEQVRTVVQPAAPNPKP